MQDEVSAVAVSCTNAVLVVANSVQAQCSVLKMFVIILCSSVVVVVADVVVVIVVANADRASTVSSARETSVFCGALVREEVLFDAVFATTESC